MSIPSYLYRSRHQIYYFRYVIPPEHQDLFRQKELRRSLGTYNKQEAIRRARRWLIHLESFWDNPHYFTMDYSEIRKLLEPTIEGLPAALLRQFDKDGPLSHQSRIELQHEIHALNGLVQLDMASDTSEKLAQALLKEKGLTLDRESKPFKQLSMELTKIIAAAMQRRLEIDKEQGTYTFSPAQPGKEPHVTIPKDKTSSKRITEVIVEYLDENSPNWTSKTKDEYTSALDNFVEIVGDMAMNGLGYDTARHYKKVLQKLPARRKMSPQYRDKSIEEILRMNVPQAMSITTINKNLSIVSTFIEWAERNWYVDKNCYKGMSIAKRKRADKERDEFSDDDLKRIFEGGAIHKNREVKKPQQYWMPLIALYSGMRINEICQLRREDIKQQDGIWFFDINTDGDKTLKTAASTRIVPIHSKLIELGFIEYVDGVKPGALWPQLERLTNGSDAFGKWFSRYLRKKIGITDAGKVFHSFRHTFDTRLKRKDVPLQRIEEMVGHKPSGESGSRYGKDYDLEGQAKVIEELAYDLELDKD